MIDRPNTQPLHAMWLKSELLNHPELTCPCAEVLVSVVVGASNLSSAGYPYIVEENFNAFIAGVPHLFKDGAAILDWADRLDGVIAAHKDIEPDELTSLNRTRKVLRTMIYTAGVTAPSDLWLLRQVLGIHQGMGLLEPFRNGDGFSLEEFAATHKLELEPLRRDWQFLASRGYLLKTGHQYSMATSPEARSVFEHVEPLPKQWRINLVAAFVCYFRDGERQRAPFLTQFLKVDVPAAERGCWVADYQQIEIGYRLLPLVLGLRVAQLTQHLVLGADLTSVVPNCLPEMLELCKLAGLVDNQGKVTALGARVFERGPGPMGIIAAYDAYLHRLEDLLSGRPVDTWVSRGENVAASQDANRKTFKAGNDALDRFVADYNFSYSIYIEHAVGKGEATRQRFQRAGEENILYFGADLEDAAIDEAVKQQELGKLPKNMRFIRGADIGVPERVTAQLAAWGIPTQGAVMIVGNGFHEIRQQTNEKMKAIFEGYQKAGIFLIFTEESGLSDDDLLRTAWNTYHAAFRYVHELSGQGLRPALAADAGDRWSWSQCAEKAGYMVHNHYSTRTRTIYPFRKGAANNPSISMTYFCIPGDFVVSLGVKDENGPTG